MKHNSTPPALRQDDNQSDVSRYSPGSRLIIPTNLRAPVVFSTRAGKLTDAERTYWPRLGGIKDGTFTGHDFGFAEFLDHFDAGDAAVGYVAGCAMLRARAQAYHLPLAKAGWSQLPDLLDRQEDLNKDQYGGWRRIDGSLVKETGCHWEMQRSSLRYVPHPESPVCLVDRGISVRLPRTYGFRQFEKDMHQTMHPCSLVAFAASRPGRSHFAKLDIDPATVPHHTVYGFGTGRRTNPAHEIYLMRPREDFTRLALLAEKLVLAHVASLSDQPSS